MEPKGRERSLAAEPNCQLRGLPAAGDEPTSPGRFVRRGERTLRYVVGTGRRGLADPRLLLRNVTRLTGAPGGPTPQGEARRLRPAPLGLRPGERVRSFEDLVAPLDDRWTLERLGSMAEMEPHCGGAYTSREPVKRLFDERTRRMLSLRDVVTLEGVFCRPPVDGDTDYAGCRRSGFLLWKEARLERGEP
ncbi:MAG: hypothetical protein ACQEXJ_17990 [Myxococcota bacterium]